MRRGVLEMPLSPDGLRALALCLRDAPELEAQLDPSVLVEAKRTLESDGLDLRALIRKRCLPPTLTPRNPSAAGRYLRRYDRRPRQLHAVHHAPTEARLVRIGRRVLADPAGLFAVDDPVLLGWWALIWSTADLALRRDLWSLCPCRGAIARLPNPGQEEALKWTAS